MPGSLTHDIVQGPPPPVDRGWGGGGGSGGGSRRVSFTGLYVLLAASTMVFAALTSALVVRRGLSDDWASMAKPPILWVNTAVLLASSLALEMAPRSQSRNSRQVQHLVEHGNRPGVAVARQPSSGVAAVEERRCSYFQ